jgi:Leucine Rich repeat
MPIDKIILQRIKNNDPSLQTLAMENIITYPLAHNEAIELRNALKDNTVVTTFSLYPCKLDIDIMCLLEVLLKGNTPITTLDLGRCKLNDLALQWIVSALQKNPATVTTLKLASNPIGDDGAIHLTEALKTNNKLTSIDLSDNNIGNIGAKHFCDMLKTNANDTLTSIQFRGMDHSKTCLEIIDALETNYSLLAMDVGDKKIPEITPFLSRNAKIITCLQPLEMLANDISLFAEIDAEKMITELANLVPLKNILTLDKNHALAEKYRLLTALRHLTNAHKYMQTTEERLKLEADLDVLECLLPRFTHPSLGKIADFLLAYFILNGTISKSLVDKQPQAFWQFGVSRLQYLNCQRQLFDYKALSKLIIANRETCENEIVVLSNEEFGAIVSATVIAIEVSLAKKERERYLIQSLQKSIVDQELLLLLETSLSECQRDREELKNEHNVLRYAFNPHAWRILPLSPHFLAQLRKKYPHPEIKSFFLPTELHSIEFWVIDLAQQGSLPSQEQLENYNHITQEEFYKWRHNLPTDGAAYTEIIRVVTLCRAELKTNPGISQDGDTLVQNFTSGTLTLGKRKIAESTVAERSAKKSKTVQGALTNNLLFVGPRPNLPFGTQAPPNEKQENSLDRKLN